MIYFIISFFWLAIALFFGFVISYSGKIKNLPQIGIACILVSFVAGVTILAYAISIV